MYLYSSNKNNGRIKLKYAQFCCDVLVIELICVSGVGRLLATVPSNILEKGKAIATAYRDRSTILNDGSLGSDESPDDLKGLL